MNRILLLLEHHENRRLLAEWLSTRYQVLLPPAWRAGKTSSFLDEPFDLGILDGPALDRSWEAVQAKKEAAEPVFLPLILITPRQDVGLVTRHLWRTVDELIISPIEKVELQARVEICLRARRLSLTLRQRNEDLEALVQGMTHDLRALQRAVAGFARALQEDYGTRLEEQGQLYLSRIQRAADQMEELIDALLRFSRLGREGIRVQTVILPFLLQRCLRSLEREITAVNAQVTISGDLPPVRADPVLLQIALTNLLSNALKFVAPGIRPQITISTLVSADRCRIQVQDNGIGINPQNQQRIFDPFVRLHGVEEYPGIGLGLSTVRKAVELMGGRLGLQSIPGQGSLFWIELDRGEES